MSITTKQHHIGHDNYKKSRSISNIHNTTGTRPKNNIWFPTWRFPISHFPSLVSSFQVPEGNPYDRINLCQSLCQLCTKLVYLGLIYCWLRLTSGNHKDALRIISNIKSTINHGIIINCKQLKLHQDFEASWVSHHDGSSHTGWIKMRESFIGSKSFKQQIGSVT